METVKQNTISFMYFIVPLLIVVLLGLHFKHTILSVAQGSSSSEEEQVNERVDRQYQVAAQVFDAEKNSGGCGCPGCCSIAAL